MSHVGAEVAPRRVPAAAVAHVDLRHAGAGVHRAVVVELRGELGSGRAGGGGDGGGVGGVGGGGRGAGCGGGEAVVGVGQEGLGARVQLLPTRRGPRGLHLPRHEEALDSRNEGLN